MTMSGHGHFERGADDRGHLGGAEVVGAEDALDDEEVGGPVAEADDGAQAEDDAGPVDAHGVVFEVAERGPEMGVVGCCRRCAAMLALRLVQPPASMSPRIGMRAAPAQMRTNCRTSLMMAERRPPSMT